MHRYRSLACFYLLQITLLFVAGCNSEVTPSQSSTDTTRNDLNITPTPTAHPDESAGVEDSSAWDVVEQLKIQHSTYVAGFLSTSTGITVGAGGEIHFTADGGENWPEAENASLCRFGLEIVDDKVAWNCGNGGHVRFTADGGKSWQPVTDFGPNEPKHCRFLSFLDRYTGWAATPFQVGATTDGGTTWSEISLPEGLNKIAAIALRTANDGYLLDNKGNLFSTQDGGLNWTHRSIDLAKELALVDSSTPMAAMRWLDSEKGLVAVSLVGGGESKVLIYRTSNGGRSWEQELVPAQFGVPFLSPDGRILTITHLGNKVTILHA